jgi:hypothetical protein
MELPKIDALALPDLPNATGVFGSHQQNPQGSGSDDTMFVLMVYLYELY